MATTRQADLIVEIGESIVEDPAINLRPWQAIALVATFSDDGEAVNGYLYGADGEFEPISPDNMIDLIDKLSDLRDEMIGNDSARWHQCLMQISKPNYGFRIRYEYDDPTRWSLRSDNDLVDTIRPASS